MWSKKIVNLVWTLAPVTFWLPRYEWKSSILSDTMSGTVVGVMQIAQGMAYAMLAGLHPVHGLYTCFFGNLFYFLFGTSRHISFGPFAVISLMSRGVHVRAASLMTTGQNLTFAQEMQGRIDVACALTFTVAIFELLFGCLQFGCLALCFSDQLIGGFTLGAAGHILTSQLFTVVDVAMINNTVPWKLLLEIEQLLLSVRAYNLASVMCFFVAILFLILTNLGCKKLSSIGKCRFPFPTELLLIVFFIFIFCFSPIGKIYNVQVVGTVPFGFPSFKTPPMDVVPHLLGTACCIALVSYSLSVSIAKRFAKMYRYDIDANQEWRAYGITHLMSSFFSCHVASASLTRTFVQAESGGKSQLASLIASFIMLIALLCCDRAFAYLPKVILATITIFALKGIAKEVKKACSLWKDRRQDLAVWVVSFVSTLALDVTFGLLVGVAFNFTVFLWKLRRPLFNLSTKVVTNCGGQAKCKWLKINALKICGLVCFLNADVFKKIIINACGRKSVSLFPDELVEDSVFTAIIDGSRMVAIDATAVEEIYQAILYLNGQKVKVYLCDFDAYTSHMLCKLGCTEEETIFCHSYEEAVKQACTFQPLSSSTI